MMEDDDLLPVNLLTLTFNFTNLPLSSTISYYTREWTDTELFGWGNIEENIQFFVEILSTNKSFFLFEVDDIISK